MRAPTQRQVDEAAKKQKKCFNALVDSLSVEQDRLFSMYLGSRKDHEEIAQAFRESRKGSK